jgi:hypothetical protein
VGLERLADTRVVHLLDRAEQAEARVVDQHVDAAGRGYRVHDRGDAGRSGDVREDRDDPVVPGGQFGEDVAAAAGGEDGVAAAGGGEGELTAEPGGRSGDQPDLRCHAVDSSSGTASAGGDNRPTGT